MRYCSVYGCSNNSAKNKELAYFAFPNPQKDRERAIIWLENIGTGHDVDSFNFKRKVVCSKHFDKSAFKRDLQAELLGLPEKKRLNPDAVPTIFDFPSPKKKKRKDSSMLKNDCKNKQNQVSPLVANFHRGVCIQLGLKTIFFINRFKQFKFVKYNLLSIRLLHCSKVNLYMLPWSQKNCILCDRQISENFNY